jgi:hypothetical protein
MKNIILTVLLLGLLTSVSFAQRGGAPMGGNRSMTQTGPISHTSPIAGTPRYMPNAIQPDARQMPPIVRGNASPSSPTAGSSKTTVGNDQHTVAPPDAAVGPNVSHRTLQK